MGLRDKGKEGRGIGGIRGRREKDGAIRKMRDKEKGDKGKERRMEG